VDYIPAKTLLLPVNKENAVKSGIVKPEDAHLMVDTIPITLKNSSLRKSELMLLDLLANFDWERPLYFVSPSLLSSLGLQDYLQFDGYAYRLVPIRTPYTDLWNAGRIDPDVLYHNLMEVYRYGNVADPRVYVDSFVDYTFNSTNIRIAFARLGAMLARSGEKEKAVEVLDYGMEQIPVSQFRYTYQYLPYIRAYYEAGATEKGDALLESYAGNLEEYVDYFLSFPDNRQYLIEDQFADKLTALAELHRIAEDYGRIEHAARIQLLFDWLFGSDLPAADADSPEQGNEGVPVGA
jgi:tetratricopeptide (TPR) repeat protein